MNSKQILAIDIKFSAHENLTSSFVITKNHDRDKSCRHDFIFRYVRFNHARMRQKYSTNLANVKSKFAI